MNTLFLSALFLKICVNSLTLLVEFDVLHSKKRCHFSYLLCTLKTKRGVKTYLSQIVNYIFSEMIKFIVIGLVMQQ